MRIRCVWEHNGCDTLLYAVDFPGAFTRGESPDIARDKMPPEIESYTRWAAIDTPVIEGMDIVQEAACSLSICDADSDVLFESEARPMSAQEYQVLKQRCLRSAADMHALYGSIPDIHQSDRAQRMTFYGQVPRCAEEMYVHTRSVNQYYFAELGVDADTDGTILECRKRGFAQLERQADFLTRAAVVGSYGELWSLRKLLRRFIWHDRIHAKAMYKMATRIWVRQRIPNPFCF